MSLIDSHCHLDNADFNEDREAVIERALAAGVEHLMAIGTGDGPPDLEAAVRLADRHAPFACHSFRPATTAADAAKGKSR